MIVSGVSRDCSVQCFEGSKIDIVVHGRFHGFALAKALIDLGQDVVVLTNYPQQIVSRFGVEPERVRSFLAHGLATRVAAKVPWKQVETLAEPYFHMAFGKWASRNIRSDADCVYGFTGVMEEYLRTPKSNPAQYRVIVRGSSHIREQEQILKEEEERAKTRVDKPSRWMIEREEREYLLADKIYVLSAFARDSFAKRGVSTARLRTNPLGVDVARFCASAAQIEARERRILSGEPLRVLSVGTFSFRKGALDLLEIAGKLSGVMSFRFVGDLPAETHALRAHVEGTIEMKSRVPEPELAKYYHDADLFLFPTLEDGFAAVLAQASAAGLPILASTNCSAGDQTVDGKDGWILPIRDPDAFIRRLTWCDKNRTMFASIARNSGQGRSLRSWSEMGAELLEHMKSHRMEKPDHGRLAQVP